MTKLKMIAAVAASTLALGGTAIATTAQAQPWDHGYSDRAYDHRGYDDSRLTPSYVSGLDWKITNAARRGLISWAQARDLRGELGQMRPLAWRVQNGNARPWEARRLEQFVNRVDSLTSGYAYNGRRYR
jgi:hypothetical protein